MTLEAQDVVVRRGGRTVLDRVSAVAMPGRQLAVLGPSGAGKSTLLAVLAGLVEPDGGTARLAGTPLGQVPDLRRRLAVVLQGYGLLSVLSAAENVEVALQAAGRPRREVRERAAEALALVGLAARADHLVDELSGGEQQRVALARALATEPDIVLADEPTAELDAASRDRVLEVLAGIGDRGGIVVLATHDPEVAERCPDRLGLADGRVLA